MRELCQLASDELGPPLVGCSDLDLITAASDENGISKSWDVVVVCDVVAVPYSGKLSREKTFVIFTVLWLFKKVFSMKFVFFTNSRKFPPS